MAPFPTDLQMKILTLEMEIELSLASDVKTASVDGSHK